MNKKKSFLNKRKKKQMSMETKTTYEPRDETKKFKEKMDFYINEKETHIGVVLSGISSCERINKYINNVFYTFDLSKWTDKNYSGDFDQEKFDNDVRDAYDTFGSEDRRIALFYNASSLKECKEIVRLENLVNLLDEKKFPNIILVVLFEENYNRYEFKKHSEKQGILEYMKQQRSSCGKDFIGFAANALTSRFNWMYHFEQEPTNPNCRIELPKMTPNKKKVDLFSLSLIVLFIGFVLFFMIHNIRNKKKTKTKVKQ